MDWLLGNPLATMYGPYFLVLYAAVIAATIAACRWYVRRAPRASSGVPLTPPSIINPDPYETAFLRGGEWEVLRLALLDLDQHGYLTVQSRWGARPANVWQVTGGPDPRLLPDFQREVFAYFASPRTAKEVRQSNHLTSIAKRHWDSLARRLEREALTTTPEDKAAERRALALGAFLILGLGAYKLAAELSTGHGNVFFLGNVLFLVVFAWVGMLGVRKLCRAPHLSARGRTHLKALQRAYAAMTAWTAVRGQRADPSLLLLAGIFGMAALKGTAYANHKYMFDEHSRTSQDSWTFEFSNGGSDGGGGGCGGGGGGCGGCGS